MKTNGRRPQWRPRLERLEDKLAPTVFTVVNTNDGGPGSLRQAMSDADLTANVGGVPDRVEFNIPGSGAHTIHPSTSLPVIHDAVIIDGYTQPGASPNTLAVGDNAVLKIEIDGSGITAPASPSLNVFNIDSNGSTVRGFAITHAPEACIEIGFQGTPGNNNTIAGNFIGTDAGGSTFLADTGTGSGGFALEMIAGNGNVIGGTAPADRNVITGSGNGFAPMIVVQSGAGNVLQGNYIGVNKDGTAPLQPPNGAFTFGIGLNSNAAGGGTIIGGTTPGAGNVILGTGAGIVLFGNNGTGGNIIQGNFIGTNATGTAGLGGRIGIDCQTSNDTIAGNLISGGTTGILIDHTAAPGSGPTIQGNKIGTDVTGTSAIPNSLDGIAVSLPGGSPTIGGTVTGEGNTIAFNGQHGIFVSQGSGRSISGNSIFANGLRGIALFVNGDDKQTVNDPSDGDSGPNNLQNFPVLTSAAVGDTTTTVTGTLNSTPNTTFRVEFFASQAADPSGFGEGQLFVGSTNVTTDGNGDASFTFAVGGNLATQVISATATNTATGDTSEFSAAFRDVQDFVVTNTNDGGPGSLRQAILDANARPGADVIGFNIPGTGAHTMHPDDAFPVITDPVIIDGYTQPGASPNTLAVGDNAVINIEISGSSLVSDFDLFFLGCDGSTVRGLCINHVPQDAFVVGPGFVGPAGHNTIAGNFIGTDPTGSAFVGDNRTAVLLIAGTGNVIGGTAPADRNVMVGDGGGTSPVLFLGSGGAGGTKVQGNYIGLNAAGTAALTPPNSTTFSSVLVSNISSGNLIGGSEPGAGNVIVGSTSSEIFLDCPDNTVQGNFIGTNATGTAGLGGVIGIFHHGGANNTIVGNLISGVGTGIFENAGTANTVIRGNKIGTDITGTTAIGNPHNGIVVNPGPFCTIGGPNAGDGNVIAFNGGAGVVISGGPGSASILGNSIFANGGLGIDLSIPTNPADGVTPNDPGDPDTGPNNFQNFPVLTSATAGNSTTITGTLNSTPNTTFRVEFFASDAADPTGFGEGQTFLGFMTVTTNGSGDASFSVTLPAAVAAGQVVTATATDPAGNTSEFSQAVAVVGSADVIIDANTTQAFLDGLTVVHGNLIMVDVAGRTDLRLPNLTRVDGDFIVTGNPDLTVLDAPVLASVGGKVDVSNNPALTDLDLGSLSNVGGAVNVSNDAGASTIDLGSLTTVGGDVTVSDNAGASTIDLGSLNTVGGSVTVSDDAGAGTIDLGSLSNVGGSVNVSSDAGATTVDLGSLTTVGGSVNVSSNTGATIIDLDSLNTVGGDLDVSGNTSATALSLGHATSVGGSIGVNDNTSATNIDLSTVTTVSGSISVNNNSTATNIDLSAVTTVGGSINVNNDTTATNIDLGGVTTVGGSLSVNNNGSATNIDLGAVSTVGGSLSVNNNTSATTIDLSGVTTVGGDETVQAQNSATSVTANGSTQVKLFTADARMTATLAHGTFANPVKFTVTRLDPAALPPEPGQNAAGGAATIDPLAAYRFNFAIPALGQNAALTFQINVAALTVADRAAFLAALTAGRATVAVKNDVPGSVFRAFAVAAPGQPPDASHVTVVRLDANGNPLPAGSNSTPAFVRFDGVTGHFSTFAVVTVSGPPATPLVVASADAGGGPHVKVFDAVSGALVASFFAFDPHFTGGVRVAVGDVNGDGQKDVIVAAGLGGGPHVKVIDGTKLGQLKADGQIADSALLASFYAYGPSFAGGVYVAAGDVNGDGKADVVTGAGLGGGPHVKVIDGTKLRQVQANGQIKDSALLGSFFAYGTGFGGGVRVAAGDVNGDGFADVVTGAGLGGGPHVKVFDGANVAHVLRSFFAFDSLDVGGVYVAAGDMDGDHKADVVVSQGGAPFGAHVRKFDGATGRLLADVVPFPGGPPAFDVRVALTDRDGDGLADVVAAPGLGRRPVVRSFKGTTLALLGEFDAFDPAFRGGVYVG
jgi:hypothetical protein